MLASLRRSLRRKFFQGLRRIAETDDARAMVHALLKGFIERRPWLDVHGLQRSPPPYPELGQSALPARTSQRRDVIMITARFRSGSTLLWNLFRHIDGVTAYYEPLNERRWFDPNWRGSRMDATHKNVDDYWREYDGLDILQAYYREEWIRRNLYMDATFWEPGMQRYVEILIEAAAGRPVLQFNRIDFRLPWLRHHFPHAKIVHLYRHPRDQWCSALMDPACFPATGTMAQFQAHDKFYLRLWARDLQYHFPFLDERTIAHPYQMFYYIWKLSYVFGVQYADHSLAFENLVCHPEKELTALFSVVDIDNYALEPLLSLIAPPPRQRWQDYADDAWFRSHESLCETVLADFFAAGK